MFPGKSPQFIQYRVNSFSVKPSKRSVWKMCLYMYICVALYLLVNKLLSYPILVATNFISCRDNTQLSWYEQNFIIIVLLEFGGEQDKFFIGFEL